MIGLPPPPAWAADAGMLLVLLAFSAIAFLGLCSTCGTFPAEHGPAADTGGDALCEGCYSQPSEDDIAEERREAERVSDRGQWGDE